MSLHYDAYMWIQAEYASKVFSNGNQHSVSDPSSKIRARWDAEDSFASMCAGDQQLQCNLFGTVFRGDTRLLNKQEDCCMTPHLGSRLQTANKW